MEIHRYNQDESTDNTLPPAQQFNQRETECKIEDMDNFGNMDSKTEINTKMLCSACLCFGRTLRNITDEKLRQFYIDTLSELPLSSTVNICPSICWECEAFLIKVVSFREQVKDSFRKLQTYSSNMLQERLDDKPQMQAVFVKDEKPYWLRVGDATNTSLLTSNDDNQSEGCSEVDQLHLEAEELTRDGKSKKRKKTRIKKEKKTKDVKPGRVSTKQKKAKAAKKAKILTIELSYEEVLAERQKEAAKDSYLKAEFKCDSCLIPFHYEISYKEHLIRKHPAIKTEYDCPICKCAMASVESFTSHYNRHMRRYECSVCGKRASDRKVLQQHYDSTHDGVVRDYTCDVCGKISHSSDAHRYHRDSHKARVECTECDKTFCHRAGLMNHRLAVHKLNNAFPCAECGKVFRWKTSLKKHMEKHDRKGKPPEPLARCEQCDVTFASVCSYQRHMRTSLGHVTRDQLKFTCDDCGRRYSNKTKLRDHIEEKHLFKSYSCHICYKVSKNRVCLEQHIRNVHRGRALSRICHHCGRGFPTKVQLESHIRSHTGERPFICEICPTTFSQQSNLYKHNRQVHLNIKSKRQAPRKKETPSISVQPDTNAMAKDILQYPTDEKTFVL